MQAHMVAQARNGFVDQLVLYHYDFHSAPHSNISELKLEGRAQLRRLAQRALHSGDLLLIQHSPGEPQLDTLRRQHVLEMLAAMESPIPPEMVLIGKPRPHGYDALEAELWYLRQITTAGGGRGGIGSGGGGAGIGGR